MFSKEKLGLRLRTFLLSIIFHIMFWYVFFWVYKLLVPGGHIFGAGRSMVPAVEIFSVVMMVSLTFTVFNTIFNYRIMRFFPIALTQFFRLLLYAITGYTVVLWLADIHFDFSELDSLDSFIKTAPRLDAVEIRFLIYFYFNCFINYFFIEAVRKIGKGNFQHWFFGVLNRPAEEERIFMFIDLKGSTTIAEKLGHQKFSHLVQDIFNEMAIVENYGGEIYQYMGDGAIISWKLKKGLRKNNFARAFHACSLMLQRRKGYYKRKYGVEVKFKAGAHVGAVMVLQVGRLKRDISYNGDILNTAARIESKCNELKQGFLISDTLYEMMEETDQFRFKAMGDFQLRGKRKAMALWGVNPKPKPKKK